MLHIKPTTIAMSSAGGSVSS